MSSTVADNMVIELFRYVCIAMGGIVVGRALFMVATAGLRVWPKRAWASVFTWAAVGVFIVIQEIEQLGHPMLIWRLPLLFLIDAGSLYAMFGGTEEDSVAPPKESATTLRGSR